MEIVVSSFYRYIELANAESFQLELLDFCKKSDIKGKILVAKEGINGVVSGTKEQIDEYEKKLRSYKGFNNITFKRNL